ncbi:GrpB family protein [Amycolatopsis nigrescens]|uniref:GrpB family protein n=1 Tax=Amycolatopsis nigrescens TaxID=381445 RepID=UPI00037B033B|nr:GrpB family protein [Amycolatopsis nigrescens]
MNDPVPAWAHEEVAIVRYDPGWRELGRAECARLTELLGSWLVADVEHVGSTSVPGLAAKPVIDLMGLVTELDAAVAGAAEILACEGWHYLSPKLDLRPWRRFFVKPDPTGHRRVGHLHLITDGHPRWARQLAFRDALRRDPATARRYERLKRQLAEQHAQDREAYTEAKATFIAEVLGTR